MADARRSLDIVIAAKDETEAGVKSVQHHLDALKQHVEAHGAGGKGEGGGGALLKSLLGEGGGAAGKLLEELGGAASKVAPFVAAIELLHHVAEQADSAVEKLDREGASLEETYTDLAAGITPGVNGLVALDSALSKAQYNAARLRGETKDQAAEHLRGAAAAAYYSEVLKEQAEVTERLTKAREGLALSEVRGREREKEALEQSARADYNKAANEAQAFLKKHGGIASELSGAELTEYKGLLNVALQTRQRHLNEQKEQAEGFRAQDLANEREHQDRLRDAAARGQEAQMAAFSTARAAQSKAIADREKADEDSILSRRDSIINDPKSTEEQRNRAKQQANAELLAHQKEFAAQWAAFQHGIDEEDLAREFKSGQDILDAQANMQAEKLRMLHKDADADLVVAQRQRDRKQAEADRDLEIEKQKQAQNPNTAEAEKELAAAERLAAAKKAAADEQFGAEQKRLQTQGANTAQDTREEMRAALAKLRIDELREEAALGNQIAGKQAEALAIAEKYAEKRAEINRLLRDQASVLTDGEKADLQNRLAGVDKLEAIERNRLGKGGAAGSPTGNLLPHDEDARHLSGAAQAAQESMLSQIQATQNNTEALLALSRFFDDMLKPILPQFESLLPGFQTFLNNQLAPSSSGGGASIFGN